MKYQASKLQAAQSIDVEDAVLEGGIEDGWVRVRLAVAGICGTDMHYFKHFENAGFKLQRPLTLGHEACAFVEDPNGSDLKKGQLVALNPIIYCGECEFCKSGDVNLCGNKRFPGSATTVPHIDGFFQQYFDFPAFCCKPVGADVNPNHLAFAEPLSCSLHSVNLAGAKKGSRVLVTGCGPMGLLAVIGAVSKGAQVTCCDIRKEAVDMGLRLGAVDGKVIGEFEADDLNDTFDAVIEASGAVSALNSALEWVCRKGMVSILSNIQPGSGDINIHRVMLREVTVVGSFQFNKEFDEAVDIITSGEFDFDALIADQVPVSRTAEALDLAISGTAVGKVQILGPDIQ